MKFFSILFSFLLLFYFTLSQVHAEESGGKLPGISAGFKSEIERYRNLAHEPAPVLPQPDPALTNYENGLNFLRIGDGYSAIQTFKSLLTSTTASERLKKEVRTTLGYIYLEQNRPKEALEEFAFLEKTPSFRERALFGIGWSLLESEEYVKTIAIFGELINEFPDSDYIPEALSMTGYCYSKLVSFRNAVDSYQKALSAYNKMIEAQKRLLLASAQAVPFQHGFIFDNPNPDWNLSFRRMKNDPYGYELIQGADQFFQLESRVNQNPLLKGESSQFRQSLSDARTMIQKLFQRYLQEEFREKEQILQDRSIETAVELARNLVLEQAPPPQKNGVP